MKKIIFEIQKSFKGNNKQCDTIPNREKTKSIKKKKEKKDEEK